MFCGWVWYKKTSSGIQLSDTTLLSLQKMGIIKAKAEVVSEENICPSDEEICIIVYKICIKREIIIIC